MSYYEVDKECGVCQYRIRKFRGLTGYMCYSRTSRDGTLYKESTVPGLLMFGPKKCFGCPDNPNCELAKVKAEFDEKLKRRQSGFAS